MKAMTPTHKGFFWGKWLIKADGTSDMDDPPGDEWEVMNVFENCVDHDDDEYLRVFVPGVERAQPIENFSWGSEVKHIREENEHE